MSRKLNTSVVLLALSLFAVLAMGIDSCAEPKEYCKSYKDKSDVAECTVYCEKNKDFAVTSSKEHDNLIRSCQLGQLLYLSNVHAGSAEAVLECDRKFKDLVDYAKACRTGVTAEELRVSKGPGTAGSANDRETGNNH